MIGGATCSVRHAAVVAAVFVCAAPVAAQSERVGDLTVLERDVPRRLVGYGLVVGLDGTGDQSFGSVTGATHTVQSVVNLLERFGIFVPSQHLRLRNVAAVLVTAEVSPYLRAGGRFNVNVASLGDAASLRGGVLWTTALMEDVGRPVVATAQGPVIVTDAGRTRALARGGTAGRIPDGGVLEVDPGRRAVGDSVRLALRSPDLATAMRIADVVNGALGAGTAAVVDPGAVQLTLADGAADTLYALLAAVDTLPVARATAPTLVVDAYAGTVVAGGQLTVGPAVVSHRGLTLTVSGAAVPAAGAPAPGVVTAVAGVTIQEIAEGLHAAGAQPQEIGAIFEALRDVGAITATVIVR